MCVAHDARGVHYVLRAIADAAQLAGRYLGDGLNGAQGRCSQGGIRRDPSQYYVVQLSTSRRTLQLGS